MTRSSRHSSSYDAANKFILLFTVMPMLQGVDTFGNPLHKRSSTGKVCKATLPTVEKVDSCPTNNNTFEQRVQAKMCQKYPSCQNEPLIYHCLNSEEGLVEVCAPNELITGRVCSLFETGIGRVVPDYKSACAECPFHYDSNESLKYTDCMNYIKSSIGATEDNAEYMNETTSVVINITGSTETS